MTDNTEKDYFVTPYGVAVFPWLNRADTEYDANGQYHLRISIPLEEAAEFIAEMEAVRDAFWDGLPPAKQKTYNKAACGEVEYDEEGEETGNILFKCKMRANVTYKDKTGKETSFSQKPTIVDEDKNTLRELVYSGSILRAKGEYVPYAMASSKSVGVSLRLYGVQVKELVTRDATPSNAPDFDSDGGTMSGHAR